MTPSGVIRSATLFQSSPVMAAASEAHYRTARLQSNSQPIAASFRRSLRQQTMRLATEKHFCIPISAVAVYSPVTHFIAASLLVMRIDFELLQPAAPRQLLPVMAFDSATCQTAARLQLNLCCRHYAAMHTVICTASHPATQGDMLQCDIIGCCPIASWLHLNVISCCSSTAFHEHLANILPVSLITSRPDPFVT